MGRSEGGGRAGEGGLHGGAGGQRGGARGLWGRGSGRGTVTERVRGRIIVAILRNSRTFDRSLFFVRCSEFCLCGEGE